MKSFRKWLILGFGRHVEIPVKYDWELRSGKAIPIDVHAGRLTTMSRQQCAAGHAMNRLECLLDDANSLHSVFSAQRCAPSVEVMRCSVCAPANSPSSKLNFR